MAVIKRPQSPRQKMINLLYVVLMAMLAINVSSEVLDGFSLVENDLKRTTVKSAMENETVYSQIERMKENNPRKTEPWQVKALQLREASSSLFSLIDELKTAIVRQSDGPEGDISNIRNKENLEAASIVMLAPGTGRGSELREAVENYRSLVLSLLNDEGKKAVIREYFSTKVNSTDGKSWEEFMFEAMPTAAAVTMLSKIQSDVFYAEGEALHSIVQYIDWQDIRVNNLSAFVIPESKTVFLGDKFRADVVMAAVDSTKTPSVFVGDKEIRNGRIESICNSVGEFSIDGYLVTSDNNGNEFRCDFSQPYSVIEPSATLSADMMNVLYAGYDNPVSVAVPGMTLSRLSLSASEASIKKTGDGKFIVHPKVADKNIKIEVLAGDDGKTVMGEFSFRVRRLPEPAAFFSICDENGVVNKMFGGVVQKASLLGLQGLDAGIDDGLLNVPFEVLGFETVFFDNMGNAVPMVSEGRLFSDRQKESFRKLARNKRFYISKIRAIGPDGIERMLKSSMEVIVR